MSNPTASIVITTKNRKEELRAALASCIMQSVPIEVVVIDDGSTDGTSEMVRSEFPFVRLHRDGSSKGLIVQRNVGAQLASGPIVFSLDDDAVFSTPRIMEQTLAEFDHPRVGAVAIPHIDVHINPNPRPLPPEGQIYVTGSYIGLAHAVRRDLFLQLNGYREFLFQQAEEVDYCTRMLAAGYVVRAGRADLVHHFESPKRDRARQFIYLARNNLLRTWYYVPMPYMPLYLAGGVFNLARYALKRRHPIWITQGTIKGFAAIWAQRNERCPLPQNVHRLFRRLGKDRVPLAEIESQLPPMQPIKKIGYQGGQT